MKLLAALPTVPFALSLGGACAIVFAMSRGLQWSAARSQTEYLRASLANLLAPPRYHFGAWLLALPQTRSDELSAELQSSASSVTPAVLLKALSERHAHVVSHAADYGVGDIEAAKAWLSRIPQLPATSRFHLPKLPLSAEHDLYILAYVAADAAPERASLPRIAEHLENALGIMLVRCSSEPGLRRARSSSMSQRTSIALVLVAAAMGAAVAILLDRVKSARETASSVASAKQQPTQLDTCPEQNELQQPFDYRAFVAPRTWTHGDSAGVDAEWLSTHPL